jgi:single-strand DNA-binding protein
MANVNRVIMIGNLTRDPQLKYLPSQMAVVEFGLATNHKYKTASGEAREDVCFVDCTAFGKAGEIINQYCTKGKQIYIEGRLKYDTWEDKNGGGKRSKHVIIVENFQFLGGRDGAGGGGGVGGDGGQDEGYSSPPRPQQRAPQRGPGGPSSGARPPVQRPAPPPEDQTFDEGQSFKDDDIPF